MRTEKAQAIKLRLQGKSYSDINRALGVSRATLSQWLRNLPLSPIAQRRIATKRSATAKALQGANQRKSTEAAQRAYELRAAGTHTIGQLSFRDLLIAGSMLYWAEGYKKPVFQGGKTRTYHSVRMSSGDPEIIGLFSRFLRIVCGVRTVDIRINLTMRSPGDTARHAAMFARNAGVPISQIAVKIPAKEANKGPSELRPIAQLIVNNTALYHTIMGFIDGLAHTR
jgi:transposase-like protein